VVDDDVVLLQGLGEALTAAGYEPLLAADGASALSLMVDRMPDVIVADIVMPGMDGYQLLAAVRQMPQGSAVPFIFLSARGERDQVREGMDSGADDYVTKPFRSAELLQAISSRIARHRAIEDAGDRVRQDWVRHLSTTLHHELRTPLAEISAYAELLAASETQLGADDLHAVVSGLGAGVTRLGRLVADFLLLADLRSGRAAADFQSRRTLLANWPGFLADVAARYEEPARSRGVQLSTTCAEDVPPAAADPVYLADAIGRLVDNAIKFAPVGSRVVVTAESRGGAPAVDVLDDGPGIDEDLLPRLLEPLEQADRPHFEQQGVGNGLAICRGLVELHGGSLSAVRRAAGGSCFRIVLPASAESAGPLAPEG
jgi:signal transduction histidine kinase